LSLSLLLKVVPKLHAAMVEAMGCTCWHGPSSAGILDRALQAWQALYGCEKG
jgi:hypothetical protein